jgi:hypothetical protein
MAVMYLAAALAGSPSSLLGLLLLLLLLTVEQPQHSMGVQQCWLLPIHPWR